MISSKCSRRIARWTWEYNTWIIHLASSQMPASCCWDNSSKWAPQYIDHRTFDWCLKLHNTKMYLFFSLFFYDWKGKNCNVKFNATLNSSSERSSTGLKPVWSTWPTVTSARDLAGSTGRRFLYGGMHQCIYVRGCGGVIAFKEQRPPHATIINWLSKFKEKVARAPRQSLNQLLKVIKFVQIIKIWITADII